MRTTLDIAADILQAAKEIAAREKTTAGSVVSELARRGLAARGSGSGQEVERNGIRMLPRRGEVVTLAHVKKLLDEEDV
ncbi:MAG: hypothetical protein SFU85_08555 [Candidatus Methylacidiphilales bacterium]|nr:hypothetical protein [Candidatus Methylacidiphilales bacterium]